jgi:hypothetical protein
MFSFRGLKPVPVILTSLLFAHAVHAQAPEGFRWLNFKEHPPIVSNIEEALKSQDYTAIREVGVLGDFALVMTSRRDPEQTAPVGDQWSIYNVSTKDWSFAPLIFGYNLEIKDWISFQPGSAEDLGVAYLDCWECEPASLFTALHYDKQNGWRARWANKENSKQPGIVLGVTDVGDPYTNEDVDQVFAVMAPRNGAATVGTWYHSRDLGSGKITDTVQSFFVDSAGQDHSEDLRGAAAAALKLRMCKATDSLSGMLGGQDSGACKTLLKLKVRSNHP